LASAGYPGSYEKGKQIGGLEKVTANAAVTVFHAGTKLDKDQYVTSGGRVLGVTALAKNLSEAAFKAYEAADQVNWEGMRMRRDIGHRAL
jgi:phosphoribosylamine--glycine ligase